MRWATLSMGWTSVSCPVPGPLPPLQPQHDASDRKAICFSTFCFARAEPNMLHFTVYQRFDQRRHREKTGVSTTSGHLIQCHLWFFLWVVWLGINILRVGVTLMIPLHLGLGIASPCSHFPSVPCLAARYDESFPCRLVSCWILFLRHGT